MLAGAAAQEGGVGGDTAIEGGRGAGGEGGAISLRGGRGTSGGGALVEARVSSRQMHFCPPCGNMLLLENANGRLRFYCQTCPYVYELKRTVRFPAARTVNPAC